MFRFLSIILFAAIVAVGYWFISSDALLDFTRTESPRTDTKITSAEISLTNQKTPVTLSPARASTEKASIENTSTADTTQVAIEKSLTLPVLSPLQEQQAQAHVDSITSSAQQPIQITSADHFVTLDQLLTLPETDAISINLKNSDATLVSAQQPLSAQLNSVAANAQNAAAAQSFAVNLPVFKKETNNPSNASQQYSVEKTTAPQLITQSAPTTTLAVKSDNTNQLNNAANLVATASAAPSTSAKSFKTFSVTDNPVDRSSFAANGLLQTESSAILKTLKKNIEELSSVKISELTELIAGEKQQVTATAADVLETEVSKLALSPVNQAEDTVVKENPVVEKLRQSAKKHIKLKELLSATDVDENRIFYLHAVNPTDQQGIWGIIQKGLMGTFAKGILLPQANGTVKALIPEDADEMLSSKKSSFLGRLLNNKVLTTYVYNYKQGKIGKNPDYIKPGQQLIIVTFTESELMSVYQHFKNQQQ
ncbi:MAG: hypothetical protein OFPII_35730 [Osedax symbiont Rs1]|nr:MAG: hypothetical protein OFPII_35730 [Osedax symbiont Rs1]